MSRICASARCTPRSTAKANTKSAANSSAYAAITYGALGKMVL